jgi:GNAT superfamily N-acetyltransferase
MEIRPLAPGDRADVRRLVEKEWGLPVVTLTGAYDPSTLPGFVALDDAELLGAITYRLDDDGCEVVTLNALRRHRGVGTALLMAAKGVADATGRRLWLVTTNDNLEALSFYQRRGMDITALHRDFADRVRAQKHDVHDLGDGAIPFRHAFELAF